MMATRRVRSMPTTTSATSSPSCSTAIPDDNGGVPLEACNSLYPYNPNFPAECAFALLFGLTTIVHSVQAIAWKKSFCWTLLVGASWEFLAFLMRAIGARNQQDVGYVIPGQLLFLLAPLLLALPQYTGSHTGVNIAETISQIMQTFSLEKKLGYLQCDNASNNDTCIQAFADQFEFEYQERRLRCVGHIVNLMTRALHFGNDPDVLEHDLNISTVDIRIWRNWQVLIDYKDILQPLEEATMIMQGHGASGAWGVIWQTIPVVEGLLKHYENLKEDYSHVPAGPPDPSQLVATARKAENAQETVLSGSGSGSFPSDSSGQPGYHEISCSQTPKLSANLQDVDLGETRALQALAATTKTRKAVSTQGTGLSTLVPESTPFNVAGQPEYHKTLCPQMNEGWKKLDHYYELTDQSTVYVTALILHPAFAWVYLESIWRSKPNWIVHHKRKIKQLLQQGYAAAPISTREETVSTNRRYKSKLFNLEDQPNEVFEDDYKRWCRRPRDRSMLDRPPLDFWCSDAVATSYPRLQKLALNVFTIPDITTQVDLVR
ncbi:hypothetical protein Q7P37_008241 [Cladosporium fusiforme]